MYTWKYSSIPCQALCPPPQRTTTSHGQLLCPTRRSGAVGAKALPVKAPTSLAVSLTVVIFHQWRDTADMITIAAECLHVAHYRQTYLFAHTLCPALVRPSKL